MMENPSPAVVEYARKPPREPRKSWPHILAIWLTFLMPVILLVIYFALGGFGPIAGAVFAASICSCLMLGILGAPYSLAFSFGLACIQIVSYLFDSDPPPAFFMAIVFSLLSVLASYRFRKTNSPPGPSMARRTLNSLYILRLFFA